MSDEDQIDELTRVKAGRKRRCPHCQSNKWAWLGAVPTTVEELLQHLLVRYRCEKCGNEFLVEEEKGSRYVADTGCCTHCGSKNLERTSEEGADLEIWHCLQCGGYIALQ